MIVTPIPRGTRTKITLFRLLQTEDGITDLLRQSAVTAIGGDNPETTVIRTSPAIASPRLLGSLIRFMCAASVCGAAAVHAQTGMPPRTLPTKPVLARPMPSQEEIVLTNMPDDMIRLGNWKDWLPATPEPGDLPGRHHVSPPLAPCLPDRDTIDFARIRANGFHVVSLEFQRTTAPAGFFMRAGRSAAQQKNVNGNYPEAHDPAEIDRIVIKPTVYELDVVKKGKRSLLGCVATWQLSIRVKGPSGIDPYTGKRK